MTHTPLSLATLVGSRICHDLISPVGAIGNGVELIAMGGPINTPELTLISDSVANASARIKFFRIAFGVASPEQTLGAPSVKAIVEDTYAEGAPPGGLAGRRRSQPGRGADRLPRTSLR